MQVLRHHRSISYVGFSLVGVFSHGERGFRAARSSGFFSLYKDIPINETKIPTAFDNVWAEFFRIFPLSSRRFKNNSFPLKRAALFNIILIKQSIPALKSFLILTRTSSSPIRRQHPIRHNLLMGRRITSI